MANLKKIQIPSENACFLAMQKTVGQRKELHNKTCFRSWAQIIRCLNTSVVSLVQVVHRNSETPHVTMTFMIKTILFIFTFKKCVSVFLMVTLLLNCLLNAVYCYQLLLNKEFVLTESLFVFGLDY